MVQLQIFTYRNQSQHYSSRMFEDYVSLHFATNNTEYSNPKYVVHTYDSSTRKMIQLLADDIQY